MPRPKVGFSSRRPTVVEAEGIAAAALVFLAEDAGRIQRFLTDTGLAPADLQRGAGSPELATAILEYLLADESLLLTFCANSQTAPERVAPALAVLTGEASA